jgi:hypothetical protein
MKSIQLWAAHIGKKETQTNYVWNRPFQTPRHIAGENNKTDLRGQ